MIVESMTYADIRREYERDKIKLEPIAARCLGNLMKKARKIGRRAYYKTSFYTINQNHYVLTYIIELDYNWELINAKSRLFQMHYVKNTKQPYFLYARRNNNVDYYMRIDAHAVLRFMQRVPKFIHFEKIFTKEAMMAVVDLAITEPVGNYHISPSGLWPTVNDQIVNGFVHVKTFIHKSMFTKNQAAIYAEGLRKFPQSVLDYIAEKDKENVT